MGYCLIKFLALGFRSQLVFFNFELVSEGDLHYIEVVRSCNCYVSLLRKLEIIIIRIISHKCFNNVNSQQYILCLKYKMIKKYINKLNGRFLNNVLPQGFQMNTLDIERLLSFV